MAASHFSQGCVAGWLEHGGSNGLLGLLVVYITSPEIAIHPLGWLRSHALQNSETETL